MQGDSLQAGALVAIVTIFIGFLKILINDFRQTIDKQGTLFIKAIQRSDRVQKELALKLQQFSEINGELRDQVRDWSNRTVEIYKWNKKLVDERNEKKQNIK